MTLPHDTRTALWGLAAQVGLEIAVLDTSEQRTEALEAFADMLEREYLAGVQNKRFAENMLRHLRAVAS